MKSTPSLMWDISGLDKAKQAKEQSLTYDEDGFLPLPNDMDPQMKKNVEALRNIARMDRKKLNSYVYSMFHLLIPIDNVMPKINTQIDSYLSKGYSCRDIWYSLRYTYVDCVSVTKVLVGEVLEKGIETALTFIEKAKDYYKANPGFHNMLEVELWSLPKAIKKAQEKRKARDARLRNPDGTYNLDLL